MGNAAAEITPSTLPFLAGRAALVTGGGSGIGQRIAERLAQAGARVALVGRTQARLDAAAAGIVAAGAESAGFAADVRDYDALSRAIAAARERFGPLRVLVCAAAGNFPASVLQMSANAFRSVVDIDLLGTFNSCRAAFEHLDRPGASVVTISAPQAVQAMAFQAHVCAAKAGVDMLTRTLAIEWGMHGVRVNAVVPGAIDGTEGMERLAPDTAARERLARRIPLGRLGQRDDVADVVLLLCSDGARYVTGAVVPCDGGLVAAGASFTPLPAAAR